MRVLYICGQKPTYIRNLLFLKSLRDKYDVVECTSTINNYVLRNLAVLVKFIFLKKSDVDIFVVGFLGHHLVPVVKFFSKKPLIFDAFISLYDSVCFDRKYFSPQSLFGRFFFWIDKYSSNSSDSIILDTKIHKQYFHETFEIPNEKLEHIYVGADESIFFPRAQKSGSKEFNVFYYGTGLPIHGIDVILKAAKILEDHKDIKLTLVGPIKKRYTDLVNKLDLSNIVLIDWVPFDQLPIKISESNICLGGHFSDIGKAKRVISGKTFQFLAMRKPVVVGNNKANNELFHHKENIYMCDLANEQSLANAILELKNNSEFAQKIANSGYDFFIKNLGSAHISRKLSEIINKCS